MIKISLKEIYKNIRHPSKALSKVLAYWPKFREIARQEKRKDQLQEVQNQVDEQDIRNGFKRFDGQELKSVRKTTEIGSPKNKCKICYNFYKYFIIAALKMQALPDDLVSSRGSGQDWFVRRRVMQVLWPSSCVKKQ